MSGNVQTIEVYVIMYIIPVVQVFFIVPGVALVFALGRAVQLPVSEWDGVQSGRSRVRLVESGELRVVRRFVHEQCRVVFDIKRLHLYRNAVTHGCL